MANANLQVATLGGGCFWCVEAVYQRMQGVVDIESGYSGGKIKNPCYREICMGTTGHAEVVRVTFDGNVTNFEEILKVFFRTHNPTTLNRQGNDVGTQYRSVVFYHNEEQKVVAEKVATEYAPQFWDDPIVTEIAPLINYYPAEEYHQDYYENNPQQGYCVYVVKPKVDKFEKVFSDKMKKVK